MLNPAERKIETSFFLILIKWIVWCQMLSCVLFIYLLIRQPTCTLFCHRLLQFCLDYKRPPFILFSSVLISSLFCCCFLLFFILFDSPFFSSAIFSSLLLSFLLFCYLFSSSSIFSPLLLSFLLFCYLFFSSAIFCSLLFNNM